MDYTTNGIDEERKSFFADLANEFIIDFLFISEIPISRFKNEDRRKRMLDSGQGIEKL